MLSMLRQTIAISFLCVFLACNSVSAQNKNKASEQDHSSMANTSVVITAENDYRWGIDSFIRASANDTINGDQSGAFHCEGGLKFRVMYVVKDHIKKERGMCGTGDMMYECDRDTKVGYLVTANIYVTKPGQGEAKVDTLVVDIGYAREDRESAGYDRAHPRPTWRDAGTKVGKDIASAIARVVKNL